MTINESEPRRIEIQVEAVQANAHAEINVERPSVSVSVDVGTRGKDGGYYTPSVSADGNLSWQPSRVGMPPVLEANIRGPAGTGITSITIEEVNENGR